MGGSGISYQGNYYNGMSRFQELMIPNNTIIHALGNLSKDYHRIPIGPDPLTLSYIPEFNKYTKIEGLYDVKRNSYQGKNELCCVTNSTFYWGNQSNTTWTLSRNSDNPVLYTCDPDCKKISYSFCNLTHYQNCIIDKLASNEYNPDITKICNNWLHTVQSQTDTQSTLLNLLNDQMYLNCKDDLEQPYCKAWITGIRSTDNKDTNALADNVLYNQLDKSKLLCINTPKYILDQQNNFDVPYECWYSGCSDSENVYLTQYNLKNRQMCYTYNCNISIGEIKVPNSTEINIICMNKKTQSQSLVLENKLIDEENLYFPILNYFYFISFLVIFITFFLFSFI